MNRYFNAFIRMLLLCTLMIIPYGLLNGFFLNEIITFKYSLLVVFSIMCVLKSFEFGNNNAAVMTPMIYVFAITQFHLLPIVFLAVLVNLLNAIIRKYRTKEAKKLLNIKSGFNLMSDIIGVVISTWVFYIIDFYFGQLPAVVLASISIAVINILLVTIVMYLYTGTRTKFSLHMYATIMTNNIGTSVIVVYAFETYSLFGLIFASLFLISISTNLMLKSYKESIEKEIYSDALTGSFNRGFLDKILFDRLTQKDKFTLLFLDFDKFKNINDSFGHSVGDAILKHFSDSVKSVIRSEEKIFRYGGDEFCILIDQGNVVDNIIERLNKLNEVAVYSTTEYNIKYSFSIGRFSYAGEDDVTLSDVYLSASKKMSSNKKEKEYLVGTGVV